MPNSFWIEHVFDNVYTHSEYFVIRDGREYIEAYTGREEAEEKLKELKEEKND